MINEVLLFMCCWCFILKPACANQIVSRCCIAMWGRMWNLWTTLHLSEIAISTEVLDLLRLGESLLYTQGFVSLFSLSWMFFIVCIFLIEFGRELGSTCEIQFFCWFFSSCVHKQTNICKNSPLSYASKIQDTMIPWDED